MPRDELEIEISPTGAVTVRTIGIKGTRCVDVATMLAEIVGREQSRTLTPEFYEQVDSLTNEICRQRSRE